MSIIGPVQSYIVQGQLNTTAGNTTNNGSIVWEVSGSQYRSAFTGPNGTTLIATGHGSPFIDTNGTVQQTNATILSAMFVPALVASNLWTELQNPNYSLHYVGPGTIGSENVVIVETSSQATRAFFKVTYKCGISIHRATPPVQIQYQATIQPRRCINISTVTMNTTLPPCTSRRALPLRPSLYSVSNRQRTITVSSVTLNQTIATPTKTSLPGYSMESELWQLWKSSHCFWVSHPSH